MTVADFLRLPLGVGVGVVLLLWPAIWAAALILYSLYGDLIRKKSPPRRVRKAA